MPAVFKPWGKGDGELAGAIPSDENSVGFDGGEQVEAATIIEVGEESEDEGLPSAGHLPAVVVLVAGLSGVISTYLAVA